MNFLKRAYYEEFQQSEIKFFVFFTLFFLSVKSLIAERITNYEVTIQMNKNGTLTVNEVIDYEFDGAAKHGIYRDIPLR